MFHITWAPLATNLLSGLISEMVDVARRLEDERKDQNIHPPLLSCHAVVLAMAGFLSLWPTLANIQLSPGFGYLSLSSFVLSWLEVIKSFCWVVPGPMTILVPLILPTSLVNILFPL